MEAPPLDDASPKMSLKERGSLTKRFMEKTYK
jgi:hypothetical protein